MKLTVSRNALLRELNVLMEVVENKSTIPVLQYVKFEAAHSDEILVTATDIEIGMTVCCPAVVKELGVLLIHARTLHELLRAMDECEVTIDGDVLTAENFKTKLRGLPVDQFPLLPSTTVDGVDLNGTTLKECLKKIFTDEEQSRFHLNGALLEFNSTNMAIASSDGFRLAFVTEPHDAPASKTLLPKKLIEALRRFVTASAVCFIRGENHAFFFSGGRVLFSRLIDGEFPDYTRVLNRDLPTKVQFERQTLRDALARVAVLSLTKAVKFEFVGEDLTLSAGDTSEHLEVCGTFVGAIYFHSAHLLDFLDSVNCQHVDMHYGEVGTMFTTVGTSYNYVYVLNPMRA